MTPDWNGILTIALAQLPTMVIVTLGVLYNNARISDLRATMTDLINTKHQAAMEVVNARYDAMMQALLRVEGVLDARLKHLEDRER